jgi:deoxyadenosine/deoxycytidine kinase
MVKSAVLFSQSAVLQSLWKRYERCSDEKIVIYERSIKCMREVFLARQKDLLPLESFTFLTQMAKLGEGKFESHREYKPLTIYLSVAEDTMMGRVEKRARPSEKHMG